MNTVNSIVCSSSGNARAKGRFVRSALLLLCIGPAACSGTSAGTEDGGVPQTPDAATQIPDAAAPQNVVATFRVDDILSGAPLQGAKVTHGSQQKTTDGLGKATIELKPGAPYEVVAAATNYLPIHFHGIAGMADFSASHSVLTDMQLAQLGGVLGIAYDATKGIVSVAAITPDGKPLSAPMKVELMVAAGAAIVPDVSSPVGYTKSNTTLTGNLSQVYLINVPPGPVVVKVTPPSGLSCTVFPGSMPQGAEAVVSIAHEMSSLGLVCK